LTTKKIKTHSTETFREKYIAPEQKLDGLLKSDFGKFFIVKVEDMIKLIKLPVPPTKATTHSLIYLTEGEATMTIGSESYKIFKDECLIVPAGQVFSFDKLDINKGFLCNFHNDIIIGKFGNSELLQDFEFLNVWGNPRISLGLETSKYVQQLLKRIYHDYSANGLQHLDIIQSYFIAALCEINSIYKPLSNSNQTTAINISNKFKALVFTNIKSKHLVTDYASLLNITPNHLNKLVKTITGKSPIKWIDDTLVLEAKVLLFQTSLTINEVAAEIGIYDQSYFSRLFKKYEGVTPLEFRKKIDKS
jgi:AraC family transcriptional regulator, transcriptional activator of pobA